MSITVSLTENAVTVTETANTVTVASVGAQGPKGDTGATGPAGPTGPTGPAGADGVDGETYTLPVATDAILGGVKVGTGLSITDGVLSATGGSGTDAATVNSLVFAQTY